VSYEWITGCDETIISPQEKIRIAEERTP